VGAVKRAGGSGGWKGKTEQGKKRRFGTKGTGREGREGLSPHDSICVPEIATSDRPDRRYTMHLLSRPDRLLEVRHRSGVAGPIS
jgi:hypothetical protein